MTTEKWLTLIALSVIAIPVVAIVDFYVFGRVVGAREWTSFIAPCVLEVFCFIAGYMIRDKQCVREMEILNDRR